ncbi:methyltransferase [Thermoleophilia bacterium SCSIO 60948]|nr:methyltransferase [Thermoleophilia bacterium SCSIO 60948]
MIRLAVRCDPAQSEIVLAELLAVAPGGVEESSDEAEGWVEYAIYGAPSELPELGEVQAAAGEGLVSVTSEEVPEDWAERWREFHRPAWVRGRIVVRPPWVTTDEVLAAGPPEGEAAADPVVIEVEPAQAFGTGAHPTTRLCLALLLDLVDEGLANRALIDLGAGSGVLAIAAVELGFDPVLAADHDPAAVEAIADNARRNDVSIGAERLDLRTDLIPPTATLVANLTAPLLLELASRLDRAALPERLLCSGLLRTERDRVIEAFGALGYSLRAVRELGDWAGLRLEASNPPS